MRNLLTYAVTGYLGKKINNYKISVVTDFQKHKIVVITVFDKRIRGTK